METIINVRQTALILIDMHRGHLDPDVATLPVDATWAMEILANTKTLLQEIRQVGMSVIHVTTQYRANKEGIPVDAFLNTNPYSQWRKNKGKLKVVQKAAKWHNMEGSVQTEFMPDVQPLPGEHIVVKKRYNAFYGTDLDLLLRCQNIKYLIVVGVNTSNCIASTTIDGCNRDYGMVVVSDCVASAYGRHLHQIALELLENTFGWVMPLSDILDMIRSKKNYI